MVKYTMLDLSAFTGPILVTAAYFVLWYALLFRQTRTKRRLRAEYEARNQTFDRYFGQDRQMLAVDRAAVLVLVLFVEEELCVVDELDDVER